MNVAVVAYKRSRCPTAKRLADALGISCLSLSDIPGANVRHEFNGYFNWGSYGNAMYEYASIHPPLLICNRPETVIRACNKAKTFYAVQDVVDIPWFTTRHVVATRFMQQRDSASIVARHRLHGSGGRDITYHDRLPLPRAKLYTQYLDKDTELRIHVFDEKAIDVVQKLKKNGNERSIAWNFKQGYTFTHRLRVDEQSLLSAKNLAVRAVYSLGLDFGAVDVVRFNNVWYLLEVNTAPGLSIPATFSAYVEAMKGVMNRWTNASE